MNAEWGHDGNATMWENVRSRTIGNTAAFLACHPMQPCPCRSYYGVQDDIGYTRSQNQFIAKSTCTGRENNVQGHKLMLPSRQIGFPKEKETNNQTRYQRYQNLKTCDKMRVDPPVSFFCAQKNKKNSGLATNSLLGTMLQK
jgi:hypothetical protein